MNSLPLHGVKVIDFTQAMLGPTATMLLADFGADVIKVEKPDVGDLSRWSIPNDPDNAIFASVNRNKRSIVLNLSTEDGKEVARSLLRTADVVVNNFRPGVMERLGFGFEDLKEVNPGIIWAIGTGFGLKGPNVQKGGQDVLAQAMSGVMDRRSNPADALSIYPTCLADYTGAMHLAQGILLALLAREKTGEGQVVDVALFSSMLAMQTQEAAMWLMERQELNWGRFPLNAVFDTADDPIVVVGAFRKNPLRDICAALGIEDLSLESKFSDFSGQMKHKVELENALAPAFKALTRAECLRRLDDHDVLCAPVWTMAEALEDEQTKATELLWRKRDEDRVYELVGSPVRLSQTPAEFQQRPPRLGEDTSAILSEFGYSEQEMLEMRREGVTR